MIFAVNLKFDFKNLCYILYFTKVGVLFSPPGNEKYGLITYN